jgi:hypothetical protein
MDLGLQNAKLCFLDDYIASNLGPIVTIKRV